MHSLWIETYDKKYEFPKLNSSLSCDICIIGAGIFGMSCAYYLTKLGFKVIVIEKSEINENSRIEKEIENTGVVIYEK